MVTFKCLLGFMFCFLTSFSAVIYASLVAQKPALILLTEYRSDIDVKEWLLSEKLDGVRAYWNGKQLLSRNGHQIMAPEWFIKNFPPFELDGELWIGRDQFQETVSVVRKQTPDVRWKNVTYQIFEVPNQPGHLLKRLDVLQRYLETTSVPYVKLIEQSVIHEVSEVDIQLQKVLALKGEGLVLRHPERLYHTGRSSDAVKVKLKQDAECVVVGYTQGKGKYEGQTGALTCQLLPNTFTALTLDADRVIKIGSGLTDAMRKNPPKVGRFITFQYMGLTKKGLPRFPVFLRVRPE